MKATTTQDERIHTDTIRSRRRPLTIPTTMLAAAINRFGGPDVLTVQALAVPKIGPRDVLIALDTAGVGGWDADLRTGRFAEGKMKFPLVLGTDGAGVVVAVGSRVRRLKIGDKVYSYNWNNPKGGFYAEYVAVDADKVAHIPKRLDLMHAAAIPTLGLTALQGVDDALHLRRGETVIVHGASGGVGMFAVQFAKWRGARVLGTASGRDGMDFAQDLGADMVVEGRHGDIVGAALELAPDGIDAVLAFAGGDEVERCLDALKSGGRLAYPRGVEPIPKKRRGVTMVRYDAVSGKQEFARLNRAVQDAKLKIPIAETFPLMRAQRAHELLDHGHVLGKIVLRIRSL